MTTNKPEVVAYVDLHRGHGRRYVSLRRGVDHYTLSDGDQLIRLSDYEALQAECEKLRKLLSAAANYATRMEPMSAKLLSAIDAAMQEPSHDNQ